MSFKHPITHTEDIRTVAEIANAEPVYHQYFAVPENCEQFDAVGRVQFLWSHQKFYNRRFGASINDSSYSYEITSGNSDNAFSVSTNGEMTVAIPASFTATRLITVKISISADNWEETICKIDRIPVANCVFFDSSVPANSGTGTRNDPYRGWRDGFYSGNPPVGWGTAGKFYFYKRGQVHEDWTKIQNPLVGGQRPDYITIGAYGTGARPIIDGTNLATSNRFADVSNSQLNGTTVTATTNPEMVAYNVRIMDIETQNNGVSNWYPYQVGMYGKGLRFHRLKCSGLVFEDGFFWVKNNPGSAGAGDIEAVFQDIETYDSPDRAIKFESGGLIGRNFRCYTTIENSETPLSAANAPNVDLKYADLQCTDNTQGLGIQIRAENHNYEWFYLKGYQDCFNPYKHVSHNGLPDSYRPKNSYYKNILIDGCTGSIGGFVSGGGNRNAQNLKFINIDVINSPGAGPLNINQGAEGTIVEMCNLGDSGDITVDADSSGTEIRNCTVPGTITRNGNATIVNTVYNHITGSGTGSITTSITPLASAYFTDFAQHVYKPSEGSALLGAGTVIGLTMDLEGNPVQTPPAIGCYEIGAEVVDTYDLILSISPSDAGTITELTEGPYAEGDEFRLQANRKAGYIFSEWRAFGSYYIGDQNPLVSTMGAEDLPIQAVFIVDPNYVPSHKARGVRFISLEEHYGTSVYEAYNRAKANNGVMGASLMDVKWLTDRLLRHEWDMANVPFSYKDDKLYSLIGPDLTVSGGGNGSRFTKEGLLETGLDNDRPRFTYDPVTGEFLGVYLEKSSSNLITRSNEFTLWDTGTGIISGSTNGLKAGTTDFWDIYNSYIFRDSFIDKEEGVSYTNSIWIKGNNEATIGLRIGGGGQDSAENVLIEITNDWKRFSYQGPPVTLPSVYALRLLVDDRTTENIGLKIALVNGQIEKGGATSDIETLNEVITRQADKYSASGLINTLDNYALLERLNGETILKYIEPVTGTMKTYKDGTYVGVEAFTPVTDLILSSQGSDFLNAAAYYSGTLTEQERIERSIM